VRLGNKGAGGPFAPLVVVVRNIVGEKEFNKLRGKAISLHSQSEWHTCPTYMVAMYLQRRGARRGAAPPRCVRPAPACHARRPPRHTRTPRPACQRHLPRLLPASRQPRHPAACMAGRTLRPPLLPSRLHPSALALVHPHAAVIKDFCKQVGVDNKQVQAVVRLAKKNGEWLGFLA
jgi:hypothetical protein